MVLSFELDSWCESVENQYGKDKNKMDNRAEAVLINQTDLGNIQNVNQPLAPEDDLGEMKKKEKRFQAFGIGSFLYALFYTFCLYHNASGITYPFFAGGTLLFFGYFIKKSESSSAEGKSESSKSHISKKFLMICIVVAGMLNCTTDSDTLIFFNKLLMVVLMGVLLLQCWHDLTGWSAMAYIKGVMTMLFGCINNIFTSIGDMMAARRLFQIKSQKRKISPDSRRILVSVAIGLLIAMPVAAFIVILLASADAVFYKLICDTLTFQLDIDLFDNLGAAVGIGMSVIIVFTLCYGLFAYNTDPRNIKIIDGMAERDAANLDTYIAATVNGVMCMIYLLFSGIQIFGLFLGKMTLPEGYTYSSYARRGFFELVFVCLFNIMLVLFTLAYFKNSFILKILLTIICGCTYIMTISSAYRMLLYISSYQLTFLRLFVLWALVVIALVMTGVLVYVHNPGFSLFRYGLVVLTIGWLSFSALHPDYWIASYNIMAGEEGQDYDHYYLRERLSLDALPVIPEEIYNNESSIYYRRAELYQRECSGLTGVRKFNFSRDYAVRKIDI